MGPCVYVLTYVSHVCILKFPPWTITSCCMLSFPHVSLMYSVMHVSFSPCFVWFICVCTSWVNPCYSFIVWKLTYSHFPFRTVNISVVLFVLFFMLCFLWDNVGSIFYKYVWLLLNFAYLWYHGNLSCLPFSLNASYFVNLFSPGIFLRILFLMSTVMW